jgi:hypothetical protein
MAGTWYPVLGWGIFWIGLIASIILFSIKRKWYPIMYLVAISLYIFTIGFMIDVFEMGKNGIMLMLTISALIMILIGWYLSSTSNSD